MGIFGFLRRKDERAIPEPGTPEFEAAVQGSVLPDSSSGQSVSMGEPGWTVPGSSQTLDLRKTGKREEIQEVLREHGIDPDQKGQTIDASKVPGLRAAILRVLVGGCRTQAGSARESRLRRSRRRRARTTSYSTGWGLGGKIFGIRASWRSEPRGLILRRSIALRAS